MLVTALVTAAITAAAWLFDSKLIARRRSPWLDEAVIAAALLPALARNKVEGLALTKLTNIMAVVPLLALLPSPWRFAARAGAKLLAGEMTCWRRTGSPIP